MTSGHPIWVYERGPECTHIDISLAAFVIQISKKGGICGFFSSFDPRTVTSECRASDIFESIAGWRILYDATFKSQKSHLNIRGVFLV
ncbi:4716_t:CDS:1, partial [Acaulospora colombiana]